MVSRAMNIFQNFTRIFTFLFTSLLPLNAYSQQQEWPLRDSVECQTRSGLPNFFNKISSGKAVHIGFIGGSITKATGWSNMTSDWLKTYFGNDSVVCHNIGIGGTDSQYGVFRIEKHLLNKVKPDLVFVEFAVNDDLGLSDAVEKSIEGIIRKIRKTSPNADICFVFTISEQFLSDFSNGKMNLSASKHDSIAAYYNLPSVCWGVSYDKICKSDSAVFKDVITDLKNYKNANQKYVLTLDGVHPTPFGHFVYFNTLKRCLTGIFESNIQTSNYQLPAPLLADNYEDARMLPANPAYSFGMEVIFNPKTKPALSSFFSNETRMMISDNPEKYFRFKLTGRGFGLRFIPGPGGGFFKIGIKNQLENREIEVRTFDPWSTAERESALFFPLENGEYEITLKPSENILSLEDKLNIFLTDEDKKQITDNPDVYAKNEFIFSDLLILGEISKTDSNNITNNIFNVLNIISSDGKLHVTSNYKGNATCSLYALNGQIISSKRISDNETVVFELYSPGIYIMKFECENFSDTLKISFQN